MSGTFDARLAHDPFGPAANPRAYVPFAATENALRAIDDALDAGRVAALVGPPGLGKSLLLHRVALKEQRLQALYIPYCTLTLAEMCSFALGLLDWSGGPDPVVAIAQHARALGEQKSGLLLLVDDAGVMPLETAVGLENLLKLAAGALHIALAAGESEDTRRVFAAFMPNLEEIRLDSGMNEEEVERYVEARLTSASADAELRSAFGRETIDALYRASEGVPRRLNLAAQAIVRRVLGERMPSLGDRAAPAPGDPESARLATGSPISALLANEPDVRKVVESLRSPNLPPEAKPAVAEADAPSARPSPDEGRTLPSAPVVEAPPGEVVASDAAVAIGDREESTVGTYRMVRSAHKEETAQAAAQTPEPAASSPPATTRVPEPTASPSRATPETDADRGPSTPPVDLTLAEAAKIQKPGAVETTASSDPEVPADEDTEVAEAEPEVSVPAAERKSTRRRLWHVAAALGGIAVGAAFLVAGIRFAPVASDEAPAASTEVKITESAKPTRAPAATPERTPPTPSPLASVQPDAPTSTPADVAPGTTAQQAAVPISVPETGDSMAPIETEIEEAPKTEPKTAISLAPSESVAPPIPAPDPKVEALATPIAAEPVAIPTPDTQEQGAPLSDPVVPSESTPIAAVPTPVPEAAAPTPPARVEEPRAAIVPPEIVRVGINAVPWAVIEVDGVELGETPLAGVGIPSGTHTFRARMPDGSVREQTVEIGATNRHVVFD